MRRRSAGVSTARLLPTKVLSRWVVTHHAGLERWLPKCCTRRLANWSAVGTLSGSTLEDGVSNLVCPRCGAAAGENDYCSTCGLHLAEQPELLTREQWEARQVAQSPVPPDETSTTQPHHRAPTTHGNMMLAWTHAPEGVGSGSSRSGAADGPQQQPQSARAETTSPPPGFPSPYPTPRSSGTNGMAIASFVLGLVWLWGVGGVLAVVFGVIAKRQIDESGGTQSGRGLAIAGIVLGVVGLASAVIVTILIIGAASSTSSGY